METAKKIQERLENRFVDYLPHISVDCVIFGYHDNHLRVLLLRMKNTELWCLPGGGVLRNESIGDAAYRVLAERTGLEKIFLRQFQAFGEASRTDNSQLKEIFEKQGHPLDASNVILQRTVTVGYYALVEYLSVNPTCDAYTDQWKWWEVGTVPELLFDHNHILTVALYTLRQQLRYQPVGLNLLPEKFTINDLQRLYETILGQALDRANFQKKILNYDILERLEARKLGGAHKAPFLYRFDPEKYQKALHNGEMRIL